MTHPIPGADSEPLYSSAKERAAFEAEYRANWGFQFAKDVLGCYEDYTMERDFQEWQRIPRAAAKVGANVADSINTHEFRRLAEAWSNAADIGPFSCFDPERTLAAWNALVAHIDARIAAGAPAETPSGDDDALWKIATRHGLHRVNADNHDAPSWRMNVLIAMRAAAAHLTSAPAETPKPVTEQELELARLAAEHYNRPHADIPALVAFERHRMEQVKIPGMPGLSGSLPSFISGFHAAQPVPAPIAGDVEKDAALVDAHLDAVLRASGSALRHYSMPKTLSDMRTAIRAAMLANSSSGEAG